MNSFLPLQKDNRQPAIQLPLNKDVVPEFSHGSGTAETTAAQLSTDEIRLRRGVRIKAASGNANTIYVGNRAGVTASNGFPLAAGEEVFVPIDSKSKIWLIAGAASQSYSWLAY